MIDFVLNNIVMFIVVITVLVFVHEMGHFLIARRCGVRVEIFSIGFGPELFGWTGRKSKTRWRVSAIPLGGYVKFFGDANAASMPDASAPLSEADRQVSFHHKSVWQRMAIVVGGPLSNLVFAVIALAALFMIVGQSYTPPVIGVVTPGGAGAASGLQVGDRILEADGRSTDSFEDLVQAMQIHPGISFPVTVERAGKRIELSVTPRKQELVDRFGNTHELGDLQVDSLNGLARVGAVTAGGPAARAGFMPGDKVLAIDGQPIVSFEDMRQIVMHGAGKALNMTVERDGRTLQLTVTPELVTPPDSRTPIGRVGITRASISEHRTFGPAAALWHAGGKVVYMTQTIGKVIGQIVLGLRAKEEIGGPLRIAKTSGEAAQIGWEAVVMLIIGLSVTLGVFNLLPVPLLDGGHLLFYVIEAVRGRPLSQRVQEYGFRLGMVLVLSLVIFATWNDLVLLKITELVGKLGP